ncbi:MAG: 16S rRNA (guanine(527)-N(7))-methyltransferase RsmG [Planctomycetes bacterium]|nr:16S rRNA (guanine(527)-N(7))-methyltransferase RsmG [Planctomycetota bacterium]
MTTPGTPGTPGNEAGMLAPTAAFTQGCATIGVVLPDEQVALLGRYLFELLETNKLFNLTAIREPEAAWMRHVLDSLSVVPLLEGVHRMIDVGSGGGLPGMVLAIARPQVKVTLLEATGKKAKFLRETAGKLGLGNVEVVNERAETAGQDKRYRERFDMAVARAVGPLNVLLELTLPLVQVGGRVVAMKGKRAEEELQAAGDALMVLGGGEVNVYEALPGLEDDADLIEVVKDHATGKTYPRRPGVPKTEPL